MAYSNIKRTPLKKPTCQCGCGKPPTLSCFGYTYAHLPPDLKEKVGAKNKLALKNRNKRNAITIKLHIAQKVANGGNDLDLWFMARRLEMTGNCLECGASTNKDNNKYYRWSVCHITPKSLCPSVAKNFFNWLELCQQCHQEFDNTFERSSKMKVFDEAKRKFRLFSCLMPQSELRKVNPLLHHPMPL